MASRDEQASRSRGSTEEQHARNRQRAAYDKRTGRRDDLYSIMDLEEQGLESDIGRLKSDLEEERSEFGAQSARGLSAKAGDTGFGGGGLLAGAQAGMEMGEGLSRMRREGAERERRLKSDMLGMRKENIKTREQEGDRDSDYATAIADGEKEMIKAISDTRGAWYEGGDDEVEAERRMRAALATLMNKNPEAADFLRNKYLVKDAEGWRANHEDD